MRTVALVTLLLCACGRLGYDRIDSGWPDGAPLDGDALDGPADTGRNAHLRFTIPASTVGEDLDSFPLLITADAAALASVGGVTGTPGFVLVEGGSPLDYDLRAPGSSGPLVAWVRVPRVHRDVATEIDLVFSGMPSGIDPSRVWQDHAAVWHLDDSPSAPIADATENGSDGVSMGTMTDAARVTGIGHLALDFDGTDDGVTVDAGPAVTAIDPLTISFWARNRAFSDNGGPLIARATTFGGTNNDFLIRAWTGCLGGGLYNGSDVNLSCVSWNDTDVWHHVALVVAGGTMSFYFDGALQEDVSYPGTAAAAGHPFRIATFGVADDTRSWNGAIDEVWFAASARTAAWIEALRASQSGAPFYETSVVTDSP